MFCPECKYEYRGGITVCPECGAELVETLAKPEPSPEFDPNERACILCTACDEFEADIIVAKLGAEGIYAYKKFQGSDSYNRIILGRTVLGVQIIVGSKSLAAAREILEN